MLTFASTARSSFSNWLIILPAELSACAILVNYWIDSTRVNNGVWITIALVVVVVINLFGSRGFGETEFWFSLIKVLTIISLIFIGIAINCGAGPTGKYLGVSLVFLALFPPCAPVF